MGQLGHDAAADVGGILMPRGMIDPAAEECAQDCVWVSEDSPEHGPQRQQCEACGRRRFVYDDEIEFPIC